MKDFFKILFLVMLVVTVYIYKNSITTFITDEIIYGRTNNVLTFNKYYKEANYKYVQNIDEFNIDNYQKLINMFYTFLNSGDDVFSFDCNYTECVTDVKKLMKSSDIISNLNNFIHPFNSFSTVNIDVTESGKVTVKSKKLYKNEQIEYIEEYINNFINNNINESQTTYEKIKLFHDHIINITEYDENNEGKSYTAYDLIITGKSICGGYSDIMSIYLNTIGVNNYRITSKNHIWNLVNIDEKWYHLDVTWDDPVASDGKQYLLDNFFMISTQQLLTLDSVEHNFNQNIYIEAN